MFRNIQTLSLSSLAQLFRREPFLKALLLAVIFILVKLFRNERFIKIVLQIFFLFFIIWALVTLVQNISTALANNNLSPNMSFWSTRAGFGIGGAEAYYSANDSFFRAFVVGLENTLRVVLVGLPLTTVIGIFFGVCLLSSNFLIKNIARVYVEVLRNTPLLIQIYAFYFIVVLGLPAIRNALEFPAGNPLFALSNRGVVFPEILPTLRTPVFLAFGFAALVIGYIVHRRLSKQRVITGKNTRAGLTTGLIMGGLLLIGYLAAVIPAPPATVLVDRDGVKTEVALNEAVEQNLLTNAERAEVSRSPFLVIGPERQGMRYATGSAYSSEYLALVLGLVIYTSAFIAEIVRAGIQAVDKGQVEASRALGLNYNKTLTMIILPQALRVIIPPLGNQYLNLAKNSSLAIAISFSDLFQVSNTIINQTGQTVSVFIFIMIAYLSMSLVISTIMNIVNSRFQLVTRSNGSRSILANIAGVFRRVPARR